MVKIHANIVSYAMADGTKCYIDVVDIVGVVMSHITSLTYTCEYNKHMLYYRVLIMVFFFH